MREALLSTLRVLAKLLPEKWQSVAGLLVSLLGFVNIPGGDPRQEKIAGIVADAMRDMENAMSLPDADAQEKARLVIENRIMRAWLDLSPGSGV